MGGQSQWKKREQDTPAAPAPRTRRDAVRRDLAVATGAESFQNRDPLQHIDESFCQTFDLLGQMRGNGAALNGGDLFSTFMKNLTPGLTEEKRQTPEQEQQSPGSLFTGAMLERTSMDPLYKPREQAPGARLLNRFGQVAFQRGNLSAAVLQGQGQMMLFSCLKRTVGQSKPNNIRERMLFQQSSSHRLLPGGRGAMSIVNKGFTDSAVGMVVDVMKNARESVDAFTQMAESGGDGSGTLQKMYPFLSDKKEQALLLDYRQRLKTLGDGPGDAAEKDVLQRAIRKTEAVIEKKDKLKRDFIQRLRQVSKNAQEASELFSREEFREELLAHLKNWEAGAEPPPDDDGDAGGSDNNTEGTDKNDQRARRRGGERGEEQTK